MLSTELQLALSPARTYRQLVAARRQASWAAGLAGPAFSLVAIGVLFSIAAAGRLTIGLALTVAASWSFAIGIQLLAAGVLIASTRRRPVEAARALELLFLGHLPWSLALLVISILTATAEATVPDILLMVLLILPIMWTVALVSAFCREVLGTTRGGARWRTVMHQAIVWALALQYVAYAAGGWFRLVPG